MKALVFLLLMTLANGVEPPTEMHGFLSYAGRPLSAEMDVAVLVYVERHGGSFVARRLFSSVPVRRGKFSIAVDLAAHPQRPLYLEFRLRRSGRAQAFEVMRPRQIILPLSGGWALTTEPGHAPWYLHIDDPDWT